MKVPKQKVEERMQHFKEECRSKGLKLTHQRLEIFRSIVESDDHPNAETVYLRVRKQLPTISLDTVYRSVWLLNDLGFIDTLGTAYNSARFDANLDCHHHFVCIRCGQTSDFYSDEFDTLKPPKSVRALGQIESTQVEVRGICLKCSKKKQKAKK